MDLDSECRNILLLKLASNVTLDEGGLPIVVSILGDHPTFELRTLYLASTSITDKHKLEGWDTRCRGFSHGVVCVMRLRRLRGRLFTGDASAVRRLVKWLRGSRRRRRTF
jgi:hypothetical protein